MAVSAVVSSVGIFVLAAEPASAASAISGNPGSDGVAQGWSHNEKIYYCASPGVGNPTAANTDLGQQAYAGLVGNNPVAPSAFFSSDPDNHMAGLSWLTAQGQDPNNNVRVIAVAMAVKYFYNSDALHQEFTNKLGYSGPNDLAAMTRWVEGPYSKADEDAANLYSQALAIKAGTTVNAGTVGVNLQVDATNNYVGTLTLTPSVPGGTATVNFTNLIDKATGKASWTGTLNGPTVINLRGVPNGNVNYEVSLTGNYTVSGTGGYNPTVDVATTPNAQTIIATGGPASGSAFVPFAGGDPQLSSAFFSPTATSTIDQAYHNAGDTVCDTVIPGLQVNPDSTTNEWPTDESGKYAPVVFSVDFYGPSATSITETATVPAGATVYSHTTVTIGGTTTNPVGSKVKVCATAPLNKDQATASGWYTQVIHVDAASQTSAGVKAFLPAGYSWTSPYGTPSEGSIVPPAIATKSRTTTGVTTQIVGANVPTTGLGLPVGDDIIVTGNVDASSGFYSIDRHYTFPNTVDANGDAVAPKTPLCDETTLDYTSPKIPVSSAGTIESAASFHSTQNGVGTWVETLYAPDGTVVGQPASCKDTNEWTFVKQLLVTTQASKNGKGKAVDTATMWGTIPQGSQMTWKLIQQGAGDDSSKDKLLVTTTPLGLPNGVANGATITSPEVTYDSTIPCVYFQEITADIDGKTLEAGNPRVASESLTGDTPITPGPLPALLSPSPVFAG